MDENNYKSVIKRNRDANGLLFGLPIVFDSNNKEVKAGEIPEEDLKKIEKDQPTEMIYIYLKYLHLIYI